MYAGNLEKHTVICDIGNTLFVYAIYKVFKKAFYNCFRLVRKGQVELCIKKPFKGKDTFTACKYARPQDELCHVQKGFFIPFISQG